MVIWSLFDGSGLMGLPWVNQGHTVYCFNADDADHGSYKHFKCRVVHPNIHYINTWLDVDFTTVIVPPDLITAFPPCTDIAVSGAAHFRRKAEINPLFQIEAVRTAKLAAYLAEYVYDCPYMIENPVSVLSSKWRKPDAIFHPYEYGGYLPEDDEHPYFPEYIKPRDAYPKKTCIWIGNGFIVPPKVPVAVRPGYSNQHSKLGGKSERTKTIRSMTPRGFAQAVFLSNVN